MTRRLATMCLTAIVVIGIVSPPGRAQTNIPDAALTLKGMSAVGVAVEELPDGAKVLGLTREAIQTDVELKLRLAGMRVVTMREIGTLIGNPYLYVQVTVTNSAKAVSINVEMHENARLERNGQSAFGVATWSKVAAGSNPDALSIRNQIRDLVDIFLNDWLSVNPKK